MELELGCSKYYYQNQDMVTTCLVTSKTGKVIARGIALCSPTDIIDKAEGRSLARRRAMRAIRGSSGDVPHQGINGGIMRVKDTVIRRPEAKKAMEGIKFNKKIYANPKLTTLEQTLLPYI